MKLNSSISLIISLLLASSLSHADEKKSIPDQATLKGECSNDYFIPYGDTTTGLAIQVFNYDQNARTIAQFSGSQSSCVYNSSDTVCKTKLANNEPAPAKFDTQVAPIPNGSRDGFTQLPNIQFWGSCNVPGSINLIISAGADQYKINLAGFTAHRVDTKPTRSGYIKRVTVNDNRQSDIYLMYYNSIYKTENFGTNNILYIANDQPDGGFVQGLDASQKHDLELYVCPRQVDSDNPDPSTCKIPPRQKP